MSSNSNITNHIKTKYTIYRTVYRRKYIHLHTLGWKVDGFMLNTSLFPQNGSISVLYYQRTLGTFLQHWLSASCRPDGFIPGSGFNPSFSFFLPVIVVRLWCQDASLQCVSSCRLACPLAHWLTSHQRVDEAASLICMPDWFVLGSQLCATPTSAGASGRACSQTPPRSRRPPERTAMI